MSETLADPPASTANVWYWLRPRADSPAMARRLLREFLPRVSGGELFEEKGALVLSELVTNAFVHGTRRDQLIKMGLEADPDGELLLIWVEDASHEAPQLCVAAEGEAGRGLLLVDRLSQQWGWGPREGIGKRVWSCIERGPAVA
ncbi:ATP-binding protein [Kitasatospora sp. NBC_01266]|uniref:ATP-binding protein n=1 Tax=Kitasatospora sp. NBC_01266 TaxID=2903572 RepID=UPI002E3415CC|nr:ATP-binding protein [Kitasatospora sp. NBC_01266]